jgi:chemotaxis signal transduction protein
MSEMENSWVLFELNEQQYGIPARDIREMIPLSRITGLPDVPDYIRGVLNLRGSIITLIDLRKRLGLRSLAEEHQNLADILVKRKEDHLNWLKELSASVVENREFKLGRDPHKCAFGVWYDSFVTNNVYLKILLDKFDVPHKRIHTIADKVDELRRQGLHDNAMRLIRLTSETDLTKMVHLFDQTIKQIKEVTEIVIVLERADCSYGLLVDSVNEVTDINGETIESPPKIQNGVTNWYISGLAKSGEDVKILLDVGALLPCN